MNIKSLFFIISFFLTTLVQANVSEGSTVPSFTLNNINGGGSVSSSSFRGKPTLLDFWASWCIPCRIALPAYEQLHQQGINVVSVTIDKDSAPAIAFLKKYGVSFKVLHDPTGEVAGQFGLPTMPTSYLIDKSGKVTKVYPGFHKGDENKILSDIKAAS